ncbi:Chymotrypsin BII [Orchesella cincta]|uniref:Chymotrypsin BII n=1 Tax=Orchesella cincta TaxID=48709 RepID=A0A1D2MCB6_ORCCI|nr:Chymotrypsin BII [Orchesella cincta]
MNQTLVLAIALCIASSAIASKLPETLIVGGEEATKNQFPYLVRFWVPAEETLRFCTGTLIALDLVLTSASCVENAGEIIVTAGDHSITEVDGTEQSMTSKIIISHENFNSANRDNDIALIKLSGKFAQTEAVKTITLPTAILNPDESEYGIALGWGAAGGARADKLQRANIRIFDSAQCEALPIVEVGEGDFCTLDTKGGSQSDNGGPLICSEMLWAVCGIMSNSIPEVGQDNSILGVYVKVPNYLEWISTNTPIDPTDPSTSTTTETSSSSTEASSTTDASSSSTEASTSTTETTGSSTEASSSTTDSSETTTSGTSSIPPESTTEAGSANLAAGFLLTFVSVLFVLY